jgi:GMP synthase-like glutamine amidotransferase
MRVHVVSDAQDRDGGYVVERLVERGAEIVEVDRDALIDSGQSHAEADLIVLLGSAKSAHEPQHARVVDAECELIRDSLRAGVPVMGICYGAQVMARALGGTSWRSDRAEIGWSRVDTTDPQLCPEGPWGQMHSDVFAPGPTARILGTTWRGPACFVDEAWGARAIAWQFHPEVTASTFTRWVENGYCGSLSPLQKRDLVRQARAQAPSARARAHALTDNALAYLGVVD